MILTAKEIGEITQLLDDSNYSELRLEIGTFKLRVSRRGAGRRLSDDRDDVLEIGDYDDYEDEGEPEALPAPQAAAPVASSGPAAGEADVPAPLLGNFYQAPRPGEPPFVKPGDTVTEETTIGIIEVMKLMNPIRAGVAGTVVAYAAPNGSAVEEGQALLRVKVD